MKYTFLTDTINVNQSLINYINRNQNMSIEENGDKTLITIEKPKDLHKLDFDKEILLSSNEFKRFLENTEGLIISKIEILLYTKFTIELVILIIFMKFFI